MSFGTDVSIEAAEIVGIYGMRLKYRVMIIGGVNSGAAAAPFLLIYPFSISDSVKISPEIV